MIIVYRTCSNKPIGKQLVQAEECAGKKTRRDSHIHPIMLTVNIEPKMSNRKHEVGNSAESSASDYIHNVSLLKTSTTGKIRYFDDHLQTKTDFFRFVTESSASAYIHNVSLLKTSSTGKYVILTAIYRPRRTSFDSSLIQVLQVTYVMFPY